MIWLTMAALCMAGSVSVMKAILPDADGYVACRYNGDGPSFEMVKTLRANMAESAEDKKADGTVTAWAQEQKARVTCKELLSSVEADVLWVDGAARQIWPWKEAGGSLPVFDTARVCAVDAKTARLLFGSTDILGQKVEISGITYEVVCVFELPGGISSWAADPGNGLILCPAAALAEPPPVQAVDFDIMPRDTKTPKEWTDAWLNDSRVPQPAWIDAISQRHRLLTLVAECGPILLALFILWDLGRAVLGLLRGTASEAKTCWSDRSLPASRGWRIWALGLAGASLLGLLAMWAASLARISLDVPPDYLPTRWSDLSFWPTLAREAAEEYAARRMTGALRPDMVYTHLCNLSAAFSLVAVPLLGLARHDLRCACAGGSPPRMGITFFCGIASVPLALWCVQQMGFPPAAPYGMFPLTVIFIAVVQFVEGYPPAKLLTTYIHKNQEEVLL